MQGGAPVDVLSDVLRGVRLTSSLFFCVEASSPWVAEAPTASAMAPILAPAQHVISYHVLLEGECYCELAGADPVRLEPGDIAVIPHGDRYAMSSRPGMLGSYTEAELCEWFRQTVARAVADPVRFVEGGGEAESRRVLCGFLGCDAVPFNPVLGPLPRLLHLRSHEHGADERLKHLTALALAEVREARAGRDCMLLRISDLLFVEVVRRYLDGMSGESAGWLAGLRDPLIGHALALLHRRPSHAWTVEELGRSIGASRSVLAERFSALVGQPPMQYLTHWRIQLASGLLRAPGAKVAAVALQVGYDSEAAFSRAFKGLVGVSPAEWRRQRTVPVPAAARCASRPRRRSGRC
jgi:AraC-like DNA-binding protein